MSKQAIKTIRQSARTTFSTLKIPMILFSLWALLVLSPACRAQAEINPDHFDGTDPWEIALRHSAAPKPERAPASKHARKARPEPASSFELAATRDATMSLSRDEIAIQRKPKRAVHKQKKR